MIDEKNNEIAELNKQIEVLKTEIDDANVRYQKRLQAMDKKQAAYNRELAKQKDRISKELAELEAAEAAAGKFSVVITSTGEGAPNTVITFAENDVAAGDTLRVAYRRRVNGASVATVKTNSTTAKGALYAHWPVYSSGTDCTESSVKGYLHLYIPRVRVTALPGFDNSYKSAATNAVTFSAIDPKRADEKMYDLYYEPLDANGEIVTTSTGTVSWN